MSAVPVADAASGAINKQINYQGKLMDSAGDIVADGSYEMALSLYNSTSLAAVPFWTASGTVGAPTQIPVTVSNGLFTVMLGDSSASGGWQNTLEGVDWNNDSIYLGVKIGADAEMTPRKRLGSVATALNAGRLQGMSASGTALSGETLFSIHQTDTSLAAADRSALDVRTAGLSDSKDYIARFYNTGVVPKVSIRNDGYMSAVRVAAYASTTGSVVYGMNTGEKILGNTWGGSFNRLLVGTLAPGAVTGTYDMAAVIQYNGSIENGLCLDNGDTGDTCSFLPGSSLISEGTINASAFDLAERYSITGEVEPGDLLVADRASPMFVRKSTGTEGEERLVGIASTRPGLLLGDLQEGVSVALAGRVPTKVSVVNGAITVGDALTASPFPGVAMKATAPGQIAGYALQSATATSTIEVFVKVGYDAGSFLRNEEGIATTQGNLLVNAERSATVDATTANSWGVTWRGSIWDGLQAIKKEFTLLAQGATDEQSTFALKMGTSTLWSVNEHGSMQVASDLTIGGRFFPATRSGAQSEKYLFLDDSDAASSTYIATNADGWQANTSYDFAERYYSPDALEAGDVVLISQEGRFHVQRTLKAGDVPVGIVSTRPAFIAGAPATSTFPIALAGRVPTKISTLNGPIAIGDPLTVSSLPGVAVKAVQAGPIVGYALESYTESTIGKAEVFVNAGWWGGTPVALTGSETVSTAQMVTTATTTVATKSYQGVARILTGATKVKVTHPSLGTFPLIQVTPYGKVDAQWWTDHSTDRGFEIVLKEALQYDVTFSWRAEEMAPTDDQLFLSSEQKGQWNIYSGEVVYTDTSVVPETLPEVTSASTTGGVKNEPTVLPTEGVTSTEPMIEDVTPTSTEPMTASEPVVEPAPIVETVVESTPVSEVVTQPTPTASDPVSAPTETSENTTL